MNLEHIPFLLDENGNRVTDLEGKRQIAQKLFDEIDNEKIVYSLIDGDFSQDFIGDISEEKNRLILEI